MVLGLFPGCRGWSPDPEAGADDIVVVAAAVIEAFGICGVCFEGDRVFGFGDSLTLDAFGVGDGFGLGEGPDFPTAVRAGDFAADGSDLILGAELGLGEEIGAGAGGFVDEEDG